MWWDIRTATWIVEEVLAQNNMIVTVLLGVASLTAKPEVIGSVSNQHKYCVGWKRDWLNFFDLS